MDKDTVASILEDHTVLNLAYVDESGDPQSCALWYASDTDLAIYFLSSLSTRHGSNLQRGGPVAFTINRDDQHWSEILGIQGRGTVEVLDPAIEVWEIYTTKFSFVTQQFSNLQAALDKTELWKLTPTWIRLIDNSVSFGYKEEINL